MRDNETKPPNHSRPGLVLTGFGPFPGVANNVSLAFAEAIGRDLRRRQSKVRIDTAELAVDWRTIADQVRALHIRFQPTLTVHFGVSSCASGLVVEHTAHNVCALEPDALGCAPGTTNLMPDGPAKRTTTLNVGAVISHGRSDLGVSVDCSDDAGQYLCNAAYYVSLSCTAEASDPSAALFIHIPQSLRPNTQTWSRSVAQGVALVEAALNRL